MICFHLAHFRVLLASLAGMKHHLECHIQPNWMGQAWTEGAPVPPALTALTRDKNRPDHILENLLTFIVNNLNCLWLFVELQNEVKYRPKMFASAKHRLLYSKENKRCSALDCLSTLRAGLVSRNPGDVLTSPAAQQLPQQSIRAWAYPAFPVVTQAQGRAQGLGAQQLWACARSRFAGETTAKHWHSDYPILHCLGRWICSPMGGQSFLFPKLSIWNRNLFQKGCASNFPECCAREIGKIVRDKVGWTLCTSRSSFNNSSSFNSFLESNKAQKLLTSRLPEYLIITTFLGGAKVFKSREADTFLN